VLTASGLVRLAASAPLRAGGAVVRGSVTATAGLVREVSSGDPITEIVERQVEAVRSRLVRALGIDDLAPPAPALTRGEPGRVPVADLRAQGDELLRRLPDPAPSDREGYPAFARILRELLPDEARILRFMALAGPQPAIDVRTRTRLGTRSELIAGGINLVAQMAGCAQPDRDQEYLANLERLGMICFSAEQVEDPRRYSLVEAQPAASAAMSRARKAATVCRSIRMTRFGLEFCDVCFTLDGRDAGAGSRTSGDPCDRRPEAAE
jgi:hypothetical protein